MLTYIPITCAALFARRLSWKPIEHRRAIGLEQVRNGSRKTA